MGREGFIKFLLAVRGSARVSSFTLAAYQCFISQHHLSLFPSEEGRWLPPLSLSRAALCLRGAYTPADDKVSFDFNATQCALTTSFHSSPPFVQLRPDSSTCENYPPQLRPTTLIQLLWQAWLVNKRKILVPIVGPGCEGARYIFKTAQGRVCLPTVCESINLHVKILLHLLLWHKTLLFIFSFLSSKASRSVPFGAVCSLILFSFDLWQTAVVCDDALRARPSITTAVVASPQVSAYRRNNAASTRRLSCGL